MHYADTDALIEILRGNPNYKPYKAIITSEFNLLELAYAITRDYNPSKAREVLENVRKEVPIIHPTDEDYVDAAKFKLEQKRKGKNISLIDALGYLLTGKLGIPFLTGDKAFQNVENVEYVK